MLSPVLRGVVGIYLGSGLPPPSGPPLGDPPSGSSSGGSPPIPFPLSGCVSSSLLLPLP